MKRGRIVRRGWQQGQRGVAAVELAIILSATLFLLPALVLFGRLFYQYNVIKLACQDAALYMASLPPAAVLDDTERQLSEGIARQLVSNAAVGAGLQSPASIVSAAVVSCDDGTVCIGAIPHTFRVTASFRFNDLGLGLVDQWTNSRHEWTVSVRSSAAYGVVSESGPLGDPP